MVETMSQRYRFDNIFVGAISNRRRCDHWGDNWGERRCVDSEVALRALQSEEFVDLLHARHLYDAQRYATILLMFLSCGRLLFLSDFGHHSKLTATLRRALPDICSFFFMFAILMFAFR